MQGELFSPETIIHGAELIVLLVGGWIGLKIKDAVAGVREEQNQVKESLVKAQYDMQLNMNDKHAENKRSLEVHMAEDRTLFEGISRTLTRMDNKLDKINGK
jgi:hypothetical protein